MNILEGAHMLTHTHKWLRSRFIKITVQCGFALAILFLFSALFPASQAAPTVQSPGVDQGTPIYPPLRGVRITGQQSSHNDGIMPPLQSFPYDTSALARLRQVPAQSVPGGKIQSTITPTSGLALNISMGYYQSVFRANYWTPVRVTMANGGTDFTGRLTINVFTGPPHSDVINITSPWTFGQPVTLRHGAQQQLTVYAPFMLNNLIPTGFVATLRNEQGVIKAIQTVTRGYSVRTGDLFIGMLSDHSIDSFNLLSNVVIPHQSDSLTLSPLDASTMPDNAAALKAFDILILDDFDISTLSSDQLTALQTWVDQGGVLIEVGGPHWQRTLGTLPAALLPIQLNGTRTLPANTPLLPVDSKLIVDVGGYPSSSGKVATPIVASSATLRSQNTFYDNKILLSDGSTPLLVQAHQGQGTITYLAFDLTADPLILWDGAGLLWKTMLLNALGDQVLIAADTSISYDNGPGLLLTQGSIINMVAPGPLLQPGIVFLLLFGYILMLGPIRMLVMRGLKLPKIWTWRIFALSLLACSLLTYSTAAYQKSTQLVDNTLSLIQLTQNGSTAHVMTYHGVLMPDKGNIVLHIPAQSLALPLYSPTQIKTPLPGPLEDQPASITTGANGSTLNIAESKRWAFHPILSEQDTQLPGAVTAHLALHNNRLVGTIRNTLQADLNDIYILLPHSFVPIGHIGAGETQQVDLPLHNAPLSNGHTLADYLAQEGNLPASYFPYTNNQQPQTDFQRHMALLSALNGVGFSVLPCGGPCNRNSLTIQNSIVLPGASTVTANLTQSYDPLLISGAPATLIGWANQQLGSDTMTINGQQPGGRHESFVRMPLNIALNSTSNIPQDFIAGTAIDAENSSALLIQPGIYSMSGGSLLFSFNLAGTTRANSMTLNMPTRAGTTSNNGPNAIMQTSLYNWQTGKWDALALTQSALTINDTASYISNDGRLLLQVINPDNAPAPLIFGKPSLTFNG